MEWPALAAAAVTPLPTRNPLHFEMLPIACWILLSATLSLGYVFCFLQCDWLANGPIHQGLYVICYKDECQLRHGRGWLTGAVLVAYMLGATLMIASTLLSLLVFFFFVGRTGTGRWRIMGVVFAMKIVAVISVAASLVAAPFDIAQLFCTTQELLWSAGNCRFGLAYAVSSILCLMNACCPIIGRLAVKSEQKKAISIVAVAPVEGEGEA